MISAAPSGAAIRATRPAKNVVSPFEAYASHQEHEVDVDGELRAVNVIFLSNRECPFTCLMCDLWRNTTDERVPAGAIPQQIEKALTRLPSAKVLKLYNSGNFFDDKAIPTEDWHAIAALASGYARVIVECHPKLISEKILRFRDLLDARLEIAMGLETAHPDILARLNKNMTLDDFARSGNQLRAWDIDTRSFVLLQLPYLHTAECVSWCTKSLQFAFAHGIQTCAIVPTRSGNGIMDILAEKGDFAEPNLNLLEDAFDAGLQLNSGRVLADTWDLEHFSHCYSCLEARRQRLDAMNAQQKILPRRACASCS